MRNSISSKVERCKWCTKDSLYQEYHDNEWGIESHNDRYLFELLCLEGQQAGLSWLTILKKRENYRKLFCNFDAAQIALFDDQKIDELTKEPGIIRHRLKISAIIENSKAFLEFKKKGDFSSFIWEFVGGEQQKGSGKIVTKSKESEDMSKALKALGFKFVGPTICYAFMQACGMYNDHSSECFKSEV